MENNNFRHTPTCKKCLSCNETLDLKMFSLDKHRPDGHYVYCKPCVKITSRERYIKNSDKIQIQNKKWRSENKESYLEHQKEYSKIYCQSLRGKYQMYKGGANGRDLSFNLTIEQFEQFWQKPCCYCNSNIETIGIDRVDNNIGYEIENLIPCCSICNRAKDTLTQEEFINHCKKIANNFSISPPANNKS